MFIMSVRTVLLGMYTNSTQTPKPSEAPVEDTGVNVEMLSSRTLAKECRQNCNTKTNVCLKIFSCFQNVQINV